MSLWFLSQRCGEIPRLSHRSAVISSQTPLSPDTTLKIAWYLLRQYQKPSSKSEARRAICPGLQRTKGASNLDTGFFGGVAI